MSPPPLGSNEAYIEHVDACGRWQVTQGKASIPTSMPPILERLELTKKRWLELFRLGWGNLRGTVIGTPESRRGEAERRRGRWVIDPLAS